MCRNRRLAGSRLAEAGGQAGGRKRATFPQVLCEEEAEEEDLDHTYIVSPTGFASDSMSKLLSIVNVKKILRLGASNAEFDMEFLRKSQNTL